MLAVTPTPYSVSESSNNLVTLPEIKNDVDDLDIMMLWLNDKAYHTRRNYLRCFKRFKSWWGERPVAKVTALDFKTFAVWMSEQGLKKSSLNFYLNAVKSYFKFACTIGYLPINPTITTKTKQNKKAFIERILVEEDVVKVLRTAKRLNPRLGFALQLCYALGLRAHEVCWIKKSDILPNNMLLVKGKGGKERVISLDPKLSATMWEYAAKSDSDYVFNSRKLAGRHIGYQALYELSKRAAKEAGINKNFSPHWLRHCHATQALASGCDLDTLSKSLGHASFNITSLYLHSKNDSSSFVKWDV